MKRFLLAFCLIACGHPVIVYPPAEDDCEAACKQLADLKCVGAQPTPGPDGIFGTADDGTCVAVCENAKSEGQSLNSRCVAQATTCAAAELCQQ